TSVGGVAYQYDADGNLTFDGVNTYAYDEQNRLVSVSGPSGVTQFEYDAFGNRTAAVQNGHRTELLNEPLGLNSVLVDYGDMSNVVATSTYGLGLVEQSADAGTSYFDFDALGATADRTNNAGVITSRYAYMPFGSVLASAAQATNPVEFLGQFGVTQSANLVD